MNPNTFRSKLPIFRGKAEGIYPKTWDIAYVGRIKKYKGLNNLSKALGLLESSKFKVLVAGKGNLGTTFGSEVKMMNCWLTRDEIINHIRDSKILVLPYLEASQSGIMEIAKAFKTIVVITPVANLIEQVRDGGIGVVASSHEPRDLAKAILDAMTGAAIAYERDPLIPALNEFILEEINAWMDQ
jgi:glycosyltransferase involved in cell wall biosynthesis